MLPHEPHSRMHTHRQTDTHTHTHTLANNSRLTHVPELTYLLNSSQHARFPSSEFTDLLRQCNNLCKHTHTHTRTHARTHAHRRPNEPAAGIVDGKVTSPSHKGVGTDGVSRSARGYISYPSIRPSIHPSSASSIHPSTHPPIHPPIHMPSSVCSRRRWCLTAVCWLAYLVAVRSSALLRVRGSGERFLYLPRECLFLLLQLQHLLAGVF